MNTETIIQDFVHKVEWLHEVEYGDFKRKLSLYIKRLEENLSVRDPKAGQIIQDMRHKVIFDASGDIESAREQALELAERLKYLS